MKINLCFKNVISQFAFRYNICFIDGIQNNQFSCLLVLFSDSFCEKFNVFSINYDMLAHLYKFYLVLLKL